MQAALTRHLEATRRTEWLTGFAGPSSATYSADDRSRSSHPTSPSIISVRLPSPEEGAPVSGTAGRGRAARSSILEVTSSLKPDIVPDPVTQNAGAWTNSTVFRPKKTESNSRSVSKCMIRKSALSVPKYSSPSGDLSRTMAEPTSTGTQPTPVAKNSALTWGSSAAFAFCPGSGSRAHRPLATRAGMPLARRAETKTIDSPQPSDLAPSQTCEASRY